MTVELNNLQEFRIKMNPHLAELLVNNLLSNAVNHNSDSGVIRIWISDNEMKICNDGQQEALSSDLIFKRFTKGNSKSYGLGLAIVKEICDSHGLDITYSKGQLHCFTISIAK